MEKKCKTGDCIVSIKMKTTGGISLKINSSSKAIFENAITHTVKDICFTMKVEHAEIEIIDGGCLDFVLRARVKSALEKERGTL